MSSYFSDARKRTLSSDTTESENEEFREGEISPAYNFFGNNRFAFGEQQPKMARMGNIVYCNNFDYHARLESLHFVCAS